MDIYEFYAKFKYEIHEIYSVIISEYPYTSLSLFIKMIFYNNSAPKNGCFLWDVSFEELSDEKIENVSRFYDDVLEECLSPGIIFLSLKEFVSLVNDGYPTEDRYDYRDMSFIINEYS